jgi:hypothetical protein
MDNPFEGLNVAGMFSGLQESLNEIQECAQRDLAEKADTPIPDLDYSNIVSLATNFYHLKINLKSAKENVVITLGGCQKDSAAALEMYVINYVKICNLSKKIASAVPHYLWDVIGFDTEYLNNGRIF